MKKNQYKILSVSVSIALLLPIVAFAAGLVPCGGFGEPVCDFKQLAIMINNFVNWFLGISVSIAAITFAVAGGKMLLNPENESNRTDAKEMFKKTAMGLVIILVAWLVVHTVIVALVNRNVGALRFFK
ncbi:MAG: pilin [Candidatus Paceibacterota bacterium]|jgi:hypothetical protein